MQNEPIVSTQFKKHRKRWPAVLAAVVVAVGVTAGLLAWNVARNDRDAIAAEAAVTITADGFEPETIKAVKGQSIVLTNNDSQVHQLESDQPGFEELQVELGPGDSFSFTYDEAGTYSYRDPLAADKFRGNVVVE